MHPSPVAILELQDRNLARTVYEFSVGGEVGDSCRGVSVALGHPLLNMLGALVLMIRGVVVRQLQIDLRP